MKRLYTYIPDRWINCGELGEHAATFTAEILSEQNRFGWSYTAVILKVIVDFKWDDKTTTTIDATQAFVRLEHARKTYEEEIIRDYLSTLNSSAV